MSPLLRHFPSTEVVLLLGEDDDRTAFRRFVCETRQLRRVGWFLGWRMTGSPHEAMTGALCRGSTSCRPVPMMDSGGYVDRSMLFQSSLEFTF